MSSSRKEYRALDIVDLDNLAFFLQFLDKDKMELLLRKVNDETLSLLQTYTLYEINERDKTFLQYLDDESE